MQDLTKPLRDYQNFAVDWTLQRLFARDMLGTALFLDPGLGKTRTSLTVADMLLSLGEIRRVLVVAPLRPVYSVWPNEIRDWKFSIPHVILHEQYEPAMRMNAQLEIVNPEGLVKLQDLGGRWDLIIIDESNKFKTWGCQRMKYLRKILRKTPKRMILNGTPVANSLADLFSQIYIIDNGKRLGQTIGYFRNEYMTLGGFQGKQWIMKENKQQQLLDLVGDICLRMDAESFLDMPELVYNDVWCTLPPELLKQYKVLKRELYLRLEAGEDITVGSAAAVYMKCKQYANGVVYNKPESGDKTAHKVHEIKHKALEDLVDELAGKPILTAYQLTCDADALQARKTFKKWPRIRGRMKGSEVDKIFDQWNLGLHTGMLAQTMTVSHGSNLQKACNDVGWLGLCDSPDNFYQFNRRVYRQGVSGKQVRVHRVLMRGTVDEVMLLRVEGKLKTQDEFCKALKDFARRD
jgi:hypothetical protein